MTVDYTKFSNNGENNQSNGAVTDRRWWLVNKTDRAQTIAGVIKMIIESDTRRQVQYQISSRLYGNSTIMGVNGISVAKIVTPSSTPKDRVTFNVVQSAIDTVTSKIAKNKPKPYFLTSGGNWAQQRKAKKLNKFIEGVFYEQEAYKHATRIFKDACIVGDGVMHVYRKDDKICYERIMARELFTDYTDAYYGEPRQIHRLKNIDRQVLIETFPEKKNKIKEANRAFIDYSGSLQSISDQVTVSESWHLPSGPKAKDGLHCICIDGEVIFEEEYTKQYFPFVFMKWSERQDGFWAQGGAEQIQNIQLELNKLLWVIQRSMHLAGTFKVFLENGSKIVKEHLNNDIGAIVNYSGTAPQYVLPSMVQPELFNQVANLKNMAFEQMGISQLSATSQKPAGLNSGKALREYNDIETDRFMTIGQMYERFFLELAHHSIGVAVDIYNDIGSYPVKLPNKKYLETVDWSEIDLSEDDYVMKMYPVSSLPETPEGKLQTIQEYIQAGMLTPRTGKRLLDFPDLEQVEDIQNASEDYLNKVFEMMIDDGIYTPPRPQNDLKLARELALEYYNQGLLHNMDEDKLELINRFVDQVGMIEEQAMPQPQMEAMPQAAPMPEPTSDLIPNVPGVA